MSEVVTPSFRSRAVMRIFSVPNSYEFMARDFTPKTPKANFLQYTAKCHEDGVPVGAGHGIGFGVFDANQ